MLYYSKKKYIRAILIVMGRIEILKKHYEPRIEKFNENSKILDWESPEAQKTRFSILTDNIDLNGKSILDVGCGCGDLLDWLKSIDVNADYFGVDILKKMTDRASELHPETVFAAADIFDEGFKSEDVIGRSSFDVTFVSGIFNLNAGNNEAFLRAAVPVLAGLADKYFVFNLLDPASPDRDENYFYFEPSEAEKLASSFAGSVKIISGYLSNDYTVIASK